jgi:hypothetical protein
MVFRVIHVSVFPQCKGLLNAEARSGGGRGIQCLDKSLMPWLVLYRTLLTAGIRNQVFRLARCLFTSEEASKAAVRLLRRQKTWFLYQSVR